MKANILLQFCQECKCEVQDGIAAFVILRKSKENPAVSVKFDLKVAKDGANQNYYQVQMLFDIASNVNCTQETHGHEGQKCLYNLHFVYTALVGIAAEENEDAANFSEDEIKRKLMVEVPTLLFPYARTEISNIARTAGFVNLMIEHIDFVKLFEQQQVSTTPSNDSATPDNHQ